MKNFSPLEENFLVEYVEATVAEIHVMKNIDKNSTQLILAGVDNPVGGYSPPKRINNKNRFD